TPEQVGLLRAWIDQGLKWDDQISFGKLPPVNLFPRTPTVPAGKAPNPIDRFMAVYDRDHRLPSPSRVSDTLFARRVYLDAIGLLPSPAEISAFTADRDPAKRAKLVKTVLSRNR